MKFSIQKTFAVFGWQVNFVVFFTYVWVFLKIINIPNIKLFLKVWKIETIERKKKYMTFLREVQASWYTPIPPFWIHVSCSGFVFHNFYLFIFPYQLAILIATELLSRLLSSVISLLSMIANSSTCNFHLGKQGSPTVIQRREHMPLLCTLRFPVYIRIFYILIWSGLLTYYSSVQQQLLHSKVFYYNNVPLDLGYLH